MLPGVQQSDSIIHAAAAKSLQPCPSLCNPVDGSPPGSSVPGILQARILEWVAIAFSVSYTYICVYIYDMCVYMYSFFFFFLLSFGWAACGILVP